MNVGICGYGNLGKAMEKVILEAAQLSKANNENNLTECMASDINLVAIFSRRKVKSKYNTLVVDYSLAKNYVNKIDVMFMCGGSKTDLNWQSAEMCKYFNIVDSFDTHAKINEHSQSLQKVAIENNKVAIYSCGWDPGIFSLIRQLFNSVLNSNVHTFWGKGVSQGHSQALRNVDGVADAIQFTIPNKQIMAKVKKQKNFCPNLNETHIRQCYVCLNGTKSESEVKNAIMQIDNYFKGQQVEIEFCKQEKIDKLKKNLYHKGYVFAQDNVAKMNFNVKMKSNPEFTAKIMFAYSRAIKNLTSGAYSVLDIPLNLIKTDLKSYL